MVKSSNVRGTTGYMYTLSAIMFILGACLLVFFFFLCFSDISFIRLLITMVPVLVFGFFLSYNVRKMVGSFHHRSEEACSKASRMMPSAEP